jgi:hypothetical protein
MCAGYVIIRGQFKDIEVWEPWGPKNAGCKVELGYNVMKDIFMTV